MERRLTKHSNPFDMLMGIVMLFGILVIVTDYFGHTNAFASVNQPTLIVMFFVYVGLLIAILFRFNTYHLEKHKFWLPMGLAVPLIYVFSGFSQAIAFLVITIVMGYTFRDEPDTDRLTNSDEQTET